jgi:hypothetical protein
MRFTRAIRFSTLSRILVFPVLLLMSLLYIIFIPKKMDPIFSMDEPMKAGQPLEPKQVRNQEKVID